MTPENVCSKAAQDKVANCIKKVFSDNEKKQKLLKMFKQKMGVVCEQCAKFSVIKLIN